MPEQSAERRTRVVADREFEPLRSGERVEERHDGARWQQRVLVRVTDHHRDAAPVQLATSVIADRDGDSFRSDASAATRLRPQLHTNVRTSGVIRRRRNVANSEGTTGG